MKRFSTVLAIASAALLPVPFLVLAQALPAGAAGSSLLVTTIARDGQRVSAPIVAVNLAGDLEFDFTSGRAFTLPDGQYAVMSRIQDPATGTLGEELVTVNGATNATLDARQGRPIKVTLNGKPVNSYTDARVCAGISRVELAGTPGSLFVMPSSSPVFSFAYLATGQGAELSALTADGVPAHPGGAWHAANQAHLNLTVRSGEQFAYATMAVLQPETLNGVNCQTDLFGPLTEQAAPYQAGTLVSPGRWIVRTDDFAAIGSASDDVGGFSVPVNFVKRHSYSLTYYRAAWGPTGQLPIIVRHAIDFTPASMLTDPDGNGSEAATKSTIALSLRGRLLAKRNVSTWGNAFPDFNVRITSAGWYTLTVDTRRFHPGIASFPGVLSPRATLSWRFFAAPGQARSAPVYLATLVPAGLSLTNRAKPGATTIVSVLPNRPSNPNVPTLSDPVRSVQAWESVNGGSTWTAVQVWHSESGWIAVVRNPAHGHVDLRAEVTDVHGDTSTETIYGAYAV